MTNLSNDLQGIFQVISAEEIQNKHFYLAVQSNLSKIIEANESWCETIAQT